MILSTYKILDGNEAVCEAVRLSRVEVIAVFPITPMTTIANQLADWINSGELKAELIQPENEHGSLEICFGASAAGTRTFTASCSQGIVFMEEMIWAIPGYRLPVVMTVCNRSISHPGGLQSTHSDSLLQRDSGWIQFYCEDPQESLDTLIMAYKIAEHPEIMLPVNVNHDGNYLSYGVEKVELPDQEEVDEFLGEKNINWHVALDPERPMSVDPLTGGAGGEGPALFVRYRKGSCKAMQNALRVIKEVHEEWGRRFGRYHAPLVEEYRLDDAAYAIVTIGSMAGAGKDAVDAARNAGEKVGLIRIKTVRPFPVQALREALSKVKAVGVVDRAVSFGWNCGPMYQELLSTLYLLDERIPAVSFIGGLAGADITVEHFNRVIETTARAYHGEAFSEPIWLNEND